ncbi:MULTISPECIES: hypothetical protein [Vibrio]|uniref:hypothetical protein n=1 Tax=Vibrio TaxID=662 RepID=UPI001CDD01A1|nr:MULTISPECIES: hypothetical protein [Vibrio]MCA2422657.1 hypothetical protein [Vibrio alginolyticus]MCA2447288.1 hypothetical protein [Vibrio alginolyticus]MDW2067418.1 hypothetical protein [Vibrio sp. 1579]MDW2161454.1 hypothetical protein [Vibrio sp. 1942]MDW2183285.1 hypothetical protein [Vibrio sp. 1762]
MFKEIYLLYLLAVGLYLQYSLIPLKIRTQTLEWSRVSGEAPVIGLVAVSFALILATLLKGVLLNIAWLSPIIDWFKSIFPHQYSGTVFLVVVVIALIPVAINRRYTMDKQLKLVEGYGNQFSKMYLQSIKKGVPLKFTFNNGVFYVGYINEFHPAEKSQVLAVFRLLSGVADTATGEIKISNCLEFNRMDENADISDQVVALKTDELFSVEFWDAHNKQFKSDS